MRLGVLDIGSDTVHPLLVDVHPGASPIPFASQKLPLQLLRFMDESGWGSATSSTLISAVAHSNWRSEKMNSPISPYRCRWVPVGQPGTACRGLRPSRPPNSRSPRSSRQPRNRFAHWPESTGRPSSRPGPTLREGLHLQRLDHLTTTGLTILSEDAEIVPLLSAAPVDDVHTPGLRDSGASGLRDSGRCRPVLETPNPSREMSREIVLV